MEYGWRKLVGWYFRLVELKKQLLTGTKTDVRYTFLYTVPTLIYRTYICGSLMQCCLLTAN